MTHNTIRLQGETIMKQQNANEISLEKLRREFIGIMEYNHNQLHALNS